MPKPVRADYVVGVTRRRPRVPAKQYILICRVPDARCWVGLFKGFRDLPREALPLPYTMGADGLTVASRLHEQFPAAEIRVSRHDRAF